MGLMSKSKVVYRSAVTTLTDEVKVGFRVSKVAVWVFMAAAMGLLVGGFLMVAVKKWVILVAVVLFLVSVLVVILWNFARRRRRLLGFMRRYPDAELRGAIDGQYVKVTRKYASDFYISDFQSGLRALVKAGYGAKVAPFVKPATVVDVTKENRGLSPSLKEGTTRSSVADLRENMIEELHEEMANNAPHKYKEILDNVIKLEDKSPPEKLLSELRETGIFDKGKKQMYWVDEEGKNCFILYARALTITWEKDTRYWRWNPVKDPCSNADVEVAELLDVCSLEVKGDFETGYLTPETDYEVSYLIKLQDPKYGWEDPVDFSLTVPQNQPKDCKFDLRKLPRGRWNCFRVGVFKLSPGQSGPMYFMLRQTVGKWKKGLVILGVVISPRL